MIATSTTPPARFSRPEVPAALRALTNNASHNDGHADGDGDANGSSGAITKETLHVGEWQFLRLIALDCANPSTLSLTFEERYQSNPTTIRPCSSCNYLTPSLHQYYIIKSTTNQFELL